MKHGRWTRTAAVAAATLVAASLSACTGSDNVAQAGGGTTLTIQGDAGNPQLVENFNPLLLTGQLGGTQPHRAGVGSVQTGRAHQQRCLTRSRRPHDRGERPRGESQRDVVERSDRALATTERLRQ